MEGLLMDMDVIGSDLSRENIDKCHKNLEWLGKQTPLKSKMRLFSKDATKITKSDLPESVAAVVSETFLGPPVSRTPTTSQIEETQAMVENLLAGFLTNLKPLLPPTARVVLTLLAYRDGRDYLTMDRLHQHLEKFGYEEEPLLPEKVVKELGLNAAVAGTMIYERPDQTVCREIVRLKPLA
jgi:tRNA G10  N-methylase Trm11